MILSPEDCAALVAQANLAPNVHNTQPTRWRLDADGSVSVLEASSRRLAVGDPTGRDARVSHGAAIEGFALAASARGWTTEAVLTEPSPASTPLPAQDAVARLRLSPGGGPDPLQAFVAARQTYRGPFVTGGDPVDLGALTVVGDVRLASTPEEIAHLAQLNDQAGLDAFRQGPYRAELLSWMRLSRRHPRWALDGLNAEALGMSAVEAAGAGVVLRPGVFELLDRLGVAGALTGEARLVRTARAIALFHRPEDENLLLTGRRLYRLWLEFTRLGLAAAPMSVLADDAAVRAQVSEEFGLPTGRRLITAFRLGRAPPGWACARAREPVAELMIA